MAGTNRTAEQVVKIAQELLLAIEDRATITPAVIAEKIDRVIAMEPRWGEGLDREAVTDELIRRFSLWIGQNTAIKNDIGHEHWLNASRKQDWRYWCRYREWLERRLSATAVDGIDQSTDLILGLLEDPKRDGSWDRRGLVVGHVQSGKTSNYTGLICKAADAGFKIVIVLAGLHNNLRAQTQMRLDEGFLGYETKHGAGDHTIIGVGEIDADPSIRPNFATNRSEKGDFSTAIARNLGITPEQRPWLFVVKKNKTVLERLLRWIGNHVANTQDPVTGRKLVTHLPLLLIDDEADHASVDTGEQPFDSDGKPDVEHEPTAINSRIRKILHLFTRSAYVGYTATPFANIFIHERGETRDEGPDLFPSAFIVNLAAASDYVGPAKVFGLATPDDIKPGLPLVRDIRDHESANGLEGWMPSGHKKAHTPTYAGADALPPSLITAIDAFILACAVRVLRKQGNQHASMLVHVTRFTAVQDEVCRQVTEHVQHMRQRILRHIDDETVLLRLHSLWEDDFVPTTRAVALSGSDRIPLRGLKWDEISATLPEILNDIQIKTINGTAKDALDYADQKTIGMRVIAIGGDKLARGLTLEGLCVSYFLRASKMYDTLMQMGRWFGYRPGYLDVCRLYTTEELCEWFGHITAAAEELREEFDMMAAAGATPKEYGLKVQSHSVLMVTSRLKMRAARNLMLSFSGQILETTAFYRDVDILRRNLDATRRLVSRLGTPEIDPKRTREGGALEWSGYLWNDVPADDVVDFLTAFRTHPEAHKVNGTLIGTFIQSMNAESELTRWTVAFIGQKEGNSADIGNRLSANMLKRKHKTLISDRYSIGRLLSPRDETIDLSTPEWTAALAATRAAWHADPARFKGEGSVPEAPSGPACRKVRRPTHGLLLLYALDPVEAEAGFAAGGPPIIGFGVSFPGSKSGVKVQYTVNNVSWELEYGPAD